jgi:putative ABC transport system permease protein
MSWFHASRARLRLLFGRRAAESRTDTEFRFHIDMETERLMREEHLDAGEARRRARVAFGGVDRHKEELRDGRGLAWISGLNLDLRLGGRMLVKYPGLTVVGVLAMAFGIWFGAVTFEMVGILQTPNLPLPDAERIVEIDNWDLKANEAEERALHDFQRWRASVRSVTDLGAYRDARPNVVGADSVGLPTVAAEITASAFRIAPDRPLHGRVLTAADERAGAPPVVVLGYELWRERFGGDPTIVGRSVKVGSGHATVVGIMPDGYGFPVAHELWMPFRADVPGVQPRTGPFISIFGKLAPGATLETAQAELTSFGRASAGEFPATHAQLQPRVRPYGAPELPSADEIKINLLITAFIVVLIVVVCSNVALLLFARAASRESEIIVRSALGASRGRIVAQLFAEALALGAVAVVVALAGAQLALSNLGRPFLERNYGRLPFWYEFDLSPTTVLIACGLAVLGAAVAGIIPARKITRGLGSRLKVGTAGGGGVKFGGVWTAVIVTQVALTVAVPAVVLLERSEIERVKAYDMGFAAEQFLGVKVGMEAADGEIADSAARAASGARFTGVLESFRRRMESEPGVVGVTFVDELPSEYHIYRLVELASLGDQTKHLVATAAIDPSYFDVLGQPPRSGRAFTSADLGADARVAIVDQAFVDLVMQGRNPVGHRVRVGNRSQFDSIPEQLPVYDVVGVVKELGISPMAMPGRVPGVYFPVVAGTRGDLHMLLRTRGDPLSFVPRLRELATTIDPTLRVGIVDRMDRLGGPQLWLLGLWMRITIGLAAITLLLSLAGIYAVLSYTVARRTREIGVRVALGASTRGIILSTFRRPLIQVTMGVMAGALLVGAAAALIGHTTQFERVRAPGLSVSDVAILAAYSALMLAVCLLACVVPTARALRVQPTEALRAD